MVERDPELAKQAKQRDDYTCVKCGYNPSNSSSLHAHHITPISGTGDDTVENLATLCKDCHRYAPDWNTIIQEDRYPRAFDNFWSTCLPPAMDFALFGSMAHELYEEVDLFGLQQLSLKQGGLPRLDPSNQWVAMATLADYKDFRDLISIEWTGTLSEDSSNGLQATMDHFSRP